MSQVISRQNLNQLIDSWIQVGKAVAAPVQMKADLVLYSAVTSSDEVLWDGPVRPANSIKEFLFPRHEKLYGYRFQGKQIALAEVEPFSADQVIVGARPCDAAALPILDHVFHWDCEDEFYSRRRERTTVITLACREHDEHCFCTSLGLSPEATQGSDVLLYDLSEGRYEVRCLTNKGKSLLSGHTEDSDAVGKADAGPETKVNPAAIEAFLAGGFESPLWKVASLRCLGCGACAYHCPTCHCFDIADEGNAAGGARVRNWDSCQSNLFTLHASGHNPRNVQGQRQRQRVYHKYRIYPEKFGVVACTGCGNCTRNCPVSLGVRNMLTAIEQTSATETSEAT